MSPVTYYYLLFKINVFFYTWFCISYFVFFFLQRALKLLQVSQNPGLTLLMWICRCLGCVCDKQWPGCLQTPLSFLPLALWSRPTSPRSAFLGLGVGGFKVPTWATAHEALLSGYDQAWFLPTSNCAGHFFKIRFVSSHIELCGIFLCCWSWIEIRVPDC